MVFRNLAGIRPDPERPGFKKIIMQPEFIEGLDFVKGTFNSVHGRIESSWARKGDKIEWHIIVPANTTAEVRIPSTTAKEIRADGEPITKVYGINRIRSVKDKIILEIGSGTYQLVINHETKK